MSSSARKRLFLLTTSLAAGALLASPAWAQRRPISPIGVPTINSPGFRGGIFQPSMNLPLMQAAAQSAIVGRAIGNVYRQIPPYALHNPYPSPIIVPGAYPIPPVPYPGPGGIPYPAGGAVLSTNPYLGAGAATLSTNPYTGAGASLDPSYTNPYMPYPYESPIGGYMRGVADITQANASYQVTIQQARLLREQVSQAQLDTRRKLIEEAQWERNFRPDAEKVRIRDMEAALTRARRNPPLTEVWSGRALNDLLRYLIGQQGKGIKGPNVPLDESILRDINVTSGTGGNVGLLKDGGTLHWPTSLMGEDFTRVRDTLNKRLPDAVQVLKFNNPVDKSAIDDMRSALREAHQILDANIKKMLPSEFIEAKRYLNQLDDALRALQDPNAPNYFTQTWVAKGKTVADLVEHMASTGLMFAPAVSGDENAYTALYNAMAAYDAGMPQVASVSTPSTPSTPSPAPAPAP